MIIWNNIIITLIVATALALTFDVLKEKYKNKIVLKTACYCPECNNELISSGSFVSDEELVTYKCTECGNESKWYFDAPVPILIEGE